jgi:hypothetical protein
MTFGNDYVPFELTDYVDNPVALARKMPPQPAQRGNTGFDLIKEKELTKMEKSILSK